MKPILTKREELIFTFKEYSLAGATAVYCPNKNHEGYKDVLLVADAFDGSDSSVGSVQWRLKDGETQWKQENLIERSYTCDLEGSKIKSGYGGICVDKKHGVLLFLSSDTFWDKGEFDSIKRCRRLYYRLSFDNGYTWTDKKLLIQQGTDQNGIMFDKTHFMEAVTYGVNSAAIVGPTMIETDDGALLTGAHVQEVNNDGSLVEPSGFMFLKTTALRAEWNSQTLDYTWTTSNYVSVSETESTRGIYEPTFAKLGQKEYIMILRASNYGKENEMLCTKFFSISQDCGKTWGTPKRLTYDDKSVMYSSSSIPKLIRHSNGKLYFVGVINSENPKGNLPRYPLCMAEIDDKTHCVIKSSVLVIDTKTMDNTCENEQFLTDFSNHCVYEDQNSKELVVIAPYRKNLTKYAGGFNLYKVKV